MEIKMANSINATYIVDEIDDDSEDQDNFTFILGPDGELKHMLIPKHSIGDLPEEVQLILDLYGIDDISNVKGRTLH